MTPKPKPKLRMPPVLDPAARLAALADWTNEPANPPPVGPAATIVVPPTLVQEQTPAPVQPIARETPAKPWALPDAVAPHPYHTVMSEGLFQKIDFIWKRAGHKSMKAWVLEVLEREADAALKDMGEL